MGLARLASVAHKWLALIVGVQILIWVATGLFFTIVPIERVRSEHRVREIAPVALRGADARALPSMLAGAPSPIKITLETRPEGAVLLAEYANAPPTLFDAQTGRRLSPLDAEAAKRIAAARITPSAPIAHTEWVTKETPEYRGVLPAWRVEFSEPGHLAFYVAANTGQVTARRSDLWRVYDALWALHIMDWRDHENFNHGLVIVAAALSLVVSVAGFVLIPYRFRWRRPARAASK